MYATIFRKTFMKLIKISLFKISEPMTVSNSEIPYLSTIRHYKSFVNLWKDKSKTFADRVFLRYPSNGLFKTLTYSQVDHITTNLACQWSEKCQNTKVISYLGEHKVDYLLIFIALLKLRSVLFNLSPRNPAGTVAYLLKKTESSVLFSSKKLEPLAREAADHLGNVSVNVIEPLDIEALVNEPLNKDYKKTLDFKFSDEDIKKPVLILHSSGSTSMPKLVIYSQENFLTSLHFRKMIKKRYLHSRVVHKDNVSLGDMPFLKSSMCSLVSGESIAFLKSFPASPEEIETTIKSNKCTLVFSVPASIEQLVQHFQNGGDITALKSLNHIFCGGAQLKKEIGEWFKKQKVSFHTVYGCSEMILALTSDFNSNSKTWDSVQVPWKESTDEEKIYFFEDAENGYKHLRLAPSFFHLALNVSNRQDGSFDTNDLFIEDTKNPGYYFYVCRRDDAIILKNGENLNPLPMEDAIRQHPEVKQVMIVGSKRHCTACIVELNGQFLKNHTYEKALSAVREAVKEANKECPNYGKILPQMIKLLPKNASLPTTVKGNVVRKKAYEMYIDLIENMYTNLLSPSEDCFERSSLSAQELKSFLLKSASKVLEIAESELKNPRQSLFDLGLNSLTAIQLRNIIFQQFDYIPQNFLFENPTLLSIQKALLSYHQTASEDTVEKHYEETQSLAKFYIEQAKLDFPVVKSSHISTKKKEGHVILLT
ncbi:hypothetical protein BY458DRAFT_569237, partial [Sporodiniella umbellata]